MVAVGDRLLLLLWLLGLLMSSSTSVSMLAPPFRIFWACSEVKLKLKSVRLGKLYRLGSVLGSDVGVFSSLAEGDSLMQLLIFCLLLSFGLFRAIRFGSLPTAMMFLWKMFSSESEFIVGFELRKLQLDFAAFKFPTEPTCGEFSYENVFILPLLWKSGELACWL